mgnify:CR=1 FL=1
MADSEAGCCIGDVNCVLGVNFCKLFLLKGLWRIKGVWSNWQFSAFFRIFSHFLHPRTNWSVGISRVSWCLIRWLKYSWCGIGKHVRTDGPGRGARLETFRIQTPDK